MIKACILRRLVLFLSGLVLAQQQLLPGSCNFEQDACGYTSDSSYGRWSRNEEGRFITADSSLLYGQVRSVLQSPVLELLEWACLRLVYQLVGTASLTLHLRPQGDNFDYQLWSTAKASDSWLIASIDLKNNSNAFQILMEGQPDAEEGNSVAIFEIHIVPGYCIECNFEEHHLCGYGNQWNPNVNWYVGGSLARDPQSSLPDDHTMNNQRGHYMYVDSVYAKRFQEVAKLTSPVTTVALSGCLSFYFQREQGGGNLFSVFTRDLLGHYQELWRPQVLHTHTWTLVSLDIKAPHPLEVVFEVAFNSARGGYVAIDDISFSPEFCHRETEPTFDPSIADCDFEEGLCRYHQESQRAESKVWSRTSVRPNAYRMGDHTTGTGYFLLANTRFSSRPGYVGRFHGPFLPGNHKYCLRFYYTLHGYRKVDNALALYIYDEHNVAQEKLWSLSDGTRDLWTQVDLTYSKPMVSKVVFVSICKNFWDCGLVAIDDITVTLGDCRITADASVSLPGQCNFEAGDCGYSQDKEGDQGDWLRVRGQSPTSYTGPRGDHTTGVGHFLYIEASLMRPGHKARLLSSALRGSGAPQCLEFYFHMYGSGTGILNVLLCHGNPEHEALLWRRRGEQSVSWTRAKVDYQCSERHQIIFEAIRGPSLRSDIAIDDVVFSKGPCEDPGDTISYSGFSENFNEIEY